MRRLFIAILGTLSIVTLSACSDQPTAAMTASNAAMKAVVRKAESLINARNYEALTEVIAADYRRHSQATPGVDVSSLDEFITFLNQGAIAFPDDRALFDTLVAEGDKVAFWGRYEGTNTGPGPFPPTGKSISIEMAGIHRIENGKIAETWVTWDNTVMFTQLGLSTPPVAPPGSE